MYKKNKAVQLNTLRFRFAKLNQLLIEQEKNEIKSISANIPICKTIITEFNLLTLKPEKIRTKNQTNDELDDESEMQPISSIKISKDEDLVMI